MLRKILVLILVTIASTFAQLQIGQYANYNEQCADLYENRAFVFCSSTPEDPICAITSGEYVYGVNFCVFCITYGNSSTLIVDIGKSESECKPFKVGDIAKNDPYCRYFYNRSGPKSCTDEFHPICAVLNGQDLSSGNKCDFCSNHGYSDAKITSIGKLCRTTYSNQT